MVKLISWEQKQEMYRALLEADRCSRKMDEQEMENAFERAKQAIDYQLTYENEMTIYEAGKEEGCQEGILSTREIKKLLSEHKAEVELFIRSSLIRGFCYKRKLLADKKARLEELKKKVLERRAGAKGLAEKIAQ